MTISLEMQQMPSRMLKFLFNSPQNFDLDQNFDLTPLKIYN